MKKINKAVWLILACMVILAAVSVFFLPDELSIQWNQAGVSNTGPKWTVFLFPVLAAICMVLHVNAVPGDPRKTKTGGAYFIGIVVLFAAEAFIISNGIGLFEIKTADSRLITKCAAIILGGILIFLGNSLPKTARNYFVGVKTPWAFEDDDIWTKTQRFAAKVWVISGVFLIMVSFAPGFIPSAASLLCILAVVLLPRLYSKHIYNTEKRD